MKAFRLDELEAERAANDGAYLQFLRERNMSVGLYALDAGIGVPHEILVVYDFDEDPTVPVIERLHAELPAIRAAAGRTSPFRTASASRTGGTDGPNS